jgi:hypothetical protein
VAMGGGWWNQKLASADGGPARHDPQPRPTPAVQR